jgi:hypothetical protein
MSTGAVFFAHKKRITERNSHLAGEASESSISNGCQAKTKRRRQLAGVGTGRGGTQLHASVAGSRITAFLATAAPWEPYFMDNPRIMTEIIFFVIWNFLPLPEVKIIKCIWILKHFSKNNFTTVIFLEVASSRIEYVWTQCTIHLLEVLGGGKKQYFIFWQI